MTTTTNGTYLQHDKQSRATSEESKWMLDRLPTLPGLPPVGPPPDALTSDGSGGAYSVGQPCAPLFLVQLQADMSVDVR